MHTLRETAIRNVASGENVVIYQPANLYDCTLGDNVFVGPFVEIQGHTRIGNDSKIQSHTFICEYVTIGERCFIGHGVMFANDMFREGKPNADRESWGRIVIGNDVSIGSGASSSGGQHLRWSRDWRGQVGDHPLRRKACGPGTRQSCCGGYNKNAGHMGRHCERFSDYARQDL
ncbi:UDP-3-O-[3-hydroxymyristoyl] glucosamine N-acyltransferase [Nosema bombycis CQ1]|uniref:UDP-3-O-[3-hydroxymyristoyl] glucosamine N-acyltransferase n=1 Tax=Nosema bombycis (strain CQ1 / CVCC 102059) TaxID=578461 RepID=R0MFK0_NOSB1|nr:UDP-3-O-[3-hydroxymyristoyl] glucosamine N-acyltransferase [Nosema bombycis CQ1]|eukprot:EOB12885.1 UDP-3-O-[3-hydroxymyristoyl] glucosamine N-acyltransferase [Nosema bombycis CQ1]